MRLIAQDLLASASSHLWLLAFAVFLALMLVHRAREAALIPVLLFLDKLANRLLSGDVRETLSSRAYRMRLKKQPVWGWTADAIDAGFKLLFQQPNHCEEQWRREIRLGWHTNGL